MANIGKPLADRVLLKLEEKAESKSSGGIILNTTTATIQTAEVVVTSDGYIGQTGEGIQLSVSYGADLELVKSVLIGVAEAHPKVLKSMTPKVLLTDFGESSLQFKLLFMINNSYEHVSIKSDLRFAIDKKFREHNITIPFPQKNIHLINPTK